AAEWIDRLEEGDEKEKALFAEWLTTSQCHIEEFLKMCAVHRELEKLGSAKALSKRCADVVVDHPTVTLSQAPPSVLTTERPDMSREGILLGEYPGLRKLLVGRAGPDV